MEQHEKMVARWLTEEWDEEVKKIPQWLKNKILKFYSLHMLENPEKLIRAICLKLLEKHKDDISLHSD